MKARNGGNISGVSVIMASASIGESCTAKWHQQHRRERKRKSEASESAGGVMKINVASMA